MKGSGCIHHYKIRRVSKKYLSEFIGIMLGDGHLSVLPLPDKIQYQIIIYLNMKEKKLIKQIDKLSVKLFNDKPTLHIRKQMHCAILRISSKEVATYLIKVGLLPGDKKKHQVCVPSWIMHGNRNIKRYCIRGLINTDGSVYWNNASNYEYRYKIIQFKNSSIPLLANFKKLCEDLGYHVSKGGDKAFQIARQKEVKQFINEMGL